MNDVEYHFVCVFASPSMFFSEMSIPISFPFKTLGCVFSFIELYDFFNILDINYLLDILLLIFFPSPWFAFLFP